MAFRLPDADPQYRLDSGELCAGGTMYFFETNSTTPKNVYAEKALTTNLGSSVGLNSAGRLPDVWLSGIYSVQLKDANNVQVWLRDNVQDAQQATSTIPAPTTGTNGQALITNGTNYLFGNLTQVPDPTGNSGKQLGTDGNAAFWEAKQTIPTYTSTSLPGGIVQGSTSYQIGKMLVQASSDTAPTAAASYTSKAVTFPVAFASAPVFIGIEPNTDNVTPAGALVSWAVTSRSSTGFTVKFYAGQEHGASDWFITSAVSFKYQATGLVA